MYRKGYVVQRAGKTQARHVEYDFVRACAAWRIELVDTRAEHRVEDLSARDGSGVKVAGINSVSEHGDAIGDGEDFVEVVLNIDDADLLRFEFCDGVKEQLHFALGEGGGGFVHDDDPGSAGEGASDFDQTFVR